MKQQGMFGSALSLWNGKKEAGQAIETFSKSRPLKWPTVVESLILFACLVVVIIQRRLFAFADPP